MDRENTRGKRGLTDGRAREQSPDELGPEATPAGSHTLHLGDGVLGRTPHIELRVTSPQTRNLHMKEPGGRNGVDSSPAGSGGGGCRTIRNVSGEPRPSPGQVTLNLAFLAFLLILPKVKWLLKVRVLNNIVALLALPANRDEFCLIRF